MPKLQVVPFATTEGKSGPIQNSSERMVNMFSEMAQSGRSGIVRRQRAGLRAIYAQAGEKRCIEKHGSLHYAIIADTLYSFDGVTLTTIGVLGTATGLCTMIFNDNDQIMISDNQALYYSDGVTLSITTIPAGLHPGTLAYINGYGIVNNLGTDQFYITAANDFSAIDALDFATAESNPDALVRVFTDHNEIWLIGTDTIEIWQDVGGTDFPFQAVTSAKIERGCAAAMSVASDDNTVILIGNDGIVYRFEGFRPVRVSTHAIEEFIRNLTPYGLSAAYAVIYTDRGHKFYTIIVPGELTLQYDFASGLWNEAKTYTLNHWDIVGSAGHYADYVLTTAGISQLTPDLNTDEGGIIVRLCRSAPGWAEGRLITMTELFVDCEVGRAAIGISPSMMIRIALDGESFGNTRVLSLGTIGNYQTRPVLTGLGQGRKPVIEISVSDDVNFAIMGTLLNASVGNS